MAPEVSSRSCSILDYTHVKGPRAGYRASPRYSLARRRRSIECILVDYSAGGACLQLQKLIDLPERFEMLYGTTRKRCRIVWKRGMRIGVRSSRPRENPTKAGFSVSAPRRAARAQGGSARRRIDEAVAGGIARAVRARRAAAGTRVAGNAGARSCPAHAGRRTARRRSGRSGATSRVPPLCAKANGFANTSAAANPNVVIFIVVSLLD